MLSENTLRAVSAILTHSCALKIIPFTWNPKTMSIRVNKSKSLCITYLISFYIWINFVNILASYYFALDQATSISQRCLHRLWLISCFIASLFQFSNLRMCNEIEAFMNHYFVFQKRVKAQYFTSDSQDKIDICYLILRSFLFLTYGQSSLGGILYLTSPENPRYFVRYIPCNASSNKICLIFTCLLEYCLYVCYWHVVMLNILLMFSYWYGTSSLLRKMILPEQGTLGSDDDDKVDRCQEMNSKIHRIQNSLKLYFDCHIINKEFNSALSVYIMPSTQFLIILLSTFCNLIFIKFHEVLNFPILASCLTLSISCVGIVWFAFPMGAEINTKSIEYKFSFKRNKIKNSWNIDKYCLKTARAFRPLRIQASSLFIIRKFTVLKVINLIIYWTMRTLLIYKK